MMIIIDKGRFQISSFDRWLLLTFIVFPTIMEKFLEDVVVVLVTLFHLGMIRKMNSLSIDNLLVNGDFKQIESNGQPSFWDVNIGHGNTSIRVLPEKYLALNAVQMSVYTDDTLVTLMQTIRLQQNTNQTLLLMSFWHKTWIIFSSGSIRLEFYDRFHHRIASEYIKSLAGNITWTYVQTKKAIYTNAIFAKVVIRMNRCMGEVFIANLSLQQADLWTNETFFVVPRSDGTIFLQWDLAHYETHAARYEIYRGRGVFPSLDDMHLLITIPTSRWYGKNIYESMYTDHSTRLETIYTYRIVACDVHGTIIDQTSSKIGQADLVDDYYNITTLIAFLKPDGVHLCWRLKARTTAKFVLIYDSHNDTRLLGTYPVRETKTIVPLLNIGPYRLVTDDGREIATAKLARLARPRIFLAPTHLDFIREKINQPGHAREVFEALIKSVYNYHPDNPYNYGWPARDAALLYAITGNVKYVDMAQLALNANRINYTIYDRSAVKLLFALSTMARAQTFDWAYEAFTVQQRQALMQDFQYAISIFSSYSGAVFKTMKFTERIFFFLDDHSRNPYDKASNWVGIVKSGELILHLTLYGEESYPDDQAESRILFLVNELKLHIEHAYGPSGYMQEGLGYITYTMSVLAPAVYLAKDMGISTFDEVWSHPNWHNLILHILSLRKQRNSLQFGVGASIYSYNGVIPYIFNATNDTNIKAALKWLYDRTMGIYSLSPAYDGKDKSAALLYYPYEIPARRPDTAFPRSTSMLIDNVDGFYAFRNRYQDQNDVLIAMVSRHRRHGGWNANETLALSIISHDTTWARMPGKEFHFYGSVHKFSTPLIDGWPREPPRGKKGAYAKAVKAFTGQGGGYVSVDTSINLNITLAQREMLVDMIARDSIETIIAIQDEFVDAIPHFWHWQLSPDPRETEITLSNENNLSVFIIRGRNDSWLKGWLYNDQNTTYNNTREVLRIIKYGFNAHFQIVMALGMGTAPVANRTSYGLQVADACINFDALDQGVQVMFCPTHDENCVLLVFDNGSGD